MKSVTVQTRFAASRATRQVALHGHALPDWMGAVPRLTLPWPPQDMEVLHG